MVNYVESGRRIEWIKVQVSYNYSWAMSVTNDVFLSRVH